MFEAGAIIWRIQTVGKDVLRQDLNESEAAAKKAGEALDRTGKKTEELGKKSQTTAPKVRSVRDEIAGMSLEAQQAATTVGRSMVVIGAAVTAVSVLAVKAAIDWQTAWTGVTKTVDATPEQLADIEDGLRDLTKILPASHDEIAAVAEAAGQLGVRAEDIVKFTKTMIDLGETTNLTSDEAATSLAQLMNIFQTAPEDVGRLGAAVVALGNNGASTERDIVQMSQRIAGAAKIIGLSEGQTLGLANALASVGIEAEAGGSSVSNIMIDIANAVSEKGDKLLRWAELAGMGADEFAEKYRTKPAEALALVIEGMGRLNATGGDVFKTLSDLGQTDVRVTRSLLGLAGAGDMLRKSLELGNEAWEDQSALIAEAEKRYDTTSAKMQIARNSVVDAAISLGEELLPAVQAVAKGVGDLANFVGALPPEVTGALTVLALFTAAIALAGGTALTVVPKFVALRQAMRTLTNDFPGATAKAKGFAAFLGGPWGVALALAAAALAALNAELQKGVPTTAEIRNSLLSTADAADVLTAATKRSAAEKAIWGDYADSLKDLPGLLDKIGNDGFDWLNLSFNQQGTADSIRRVGDALAEVAGVSLPEAQDQFKRLTEAYGLTEEQQMKLLDSMPAYRDALVKQATEMGLNVTSADELANGQKLLQLAQGEGIGVTESATAAYLDAQEAAAGLGDELDALIKRINEQNDVGMDVVSTTNDYEKAIDDLAAQIDNINKGTEGYAKTLNESTQAGRDNWDVLTAVAATNRDAADAQLVLDGNTGAYLDRLKSNRDTILQNAKDLGATDEQLQFIADSIVALPDQKQIDLLLNEGSIQRRLNAIKATIDQITGAGLSLGDPSSRPTQYPKVTNNANGSVRKAADGWYAPAMSQQSAQARTAGSYVLWAEDETEGESFIPHAKSKRAQSERQLAETARLFGGEYIPPGGAKRYANGAVNGGPAGVAPVQVRVFIGETELRVIAQETVDEALTTVAVEYGGGGTT